MIINAHPVLRKPKNIDYLLQHSGKFVLRVCNAWRSDSITGFSDFEENRGICLDEIEILAKDNDISDKTVCKLAYKQNYC